MLLFFLSNVNYKFNLLFIDFVSAAVAALWVESTPNTFYKFGSSYRSSKFEISHSFNIFTVKFLWPNDFKCFIFDKKLDLSFSNFYRFSWISRSWQYLMLRSLFPRCSSFFAAFLPAQLWSSCSLFSSSKQS